MFSFNYIGSDGKIGASANFMSALAQSKGELTLSASVGKIKAVDFDAAKRGMCVLRGTHLRSVDALAFGVDGRLYFLEFKDRSFNALNKQGQVLAAEEQNDGNVKHTKSKARNQKKTINRKGIKQEPTIAVELSEKIFDSILLAGLGEEQWRIGDFVDESCVANASTVADIRRNSVFVIVVNDTSYEKDVTNGEQKFLSLGKELSNNPSCDDPQIPGAQIYWGLEKFFKSDFCSEVHTLTVPEFEKYAVGRFTNLDAVLGRVCRVAAHL